MFRRRHPVKAALLLALATAHFSACGQTTNLLEISSLQNTPNGWSLGWQSSATGTAYTVQFQDTLDDVIWRIPASRDQFPLGSNNWLDGTVTNAARYFRVLAVPAAQRGKIISATLSTTLTTSTLSLLFSIAGVPITPQYNVLLYKIDYETISPLGARTVASGALAVPQGDNSLLPLVSYQHSTILQTNMAPSSMNLNTEVSVGVAFATTGYAAVVPDYLGLGDSPGFHPFHHARSEATACVDLLRAAKEFCSTNGFPLSGKLFLCGYSQGGHATMALQRELEEYHTNEFSVTACAPMAGAYDLSGVTTTNFLSGATQPNPYYFLYLLAAYQDVYHLAPTLAAMLATPYDTNLPAMLRSNLTSAQINAAMPANPVQILKPEVLAAFRADPRYPLRLALEDNDVYRWIPQAPMRLYHCAADQDVTIANSEVALASFEALGDTQVQLIDPNATYDHSACSQPSLLLAKTWFDSLR
jgi:pimeloyl-ACP methyl ester carboxylesterase